MCNISDIPLWKSSMIWCCEYALYVDDKSLFPGRTQSPATRLYLGCVIPLLLRRQIHATMEQPFRLALYLYISGNRAVEVDGGEEKRSNPKSVKASFLPSHPITECTHPCILNHGWSHKHVTRPEIWRMKLWNPHAQWHRTKIGEGT